jgi:hypothetical protein
MYSLGREPQVTGAIQYFKPRSGGTQALNVGES